ncbi:MAG: spermidine synthase (putrescine aminopropyltransferase) [Candidatus Scalindua rubra]|uniref:Polyamine aminopropyltransferase n=1 Tax=Candidatus Scalindua rubra TaxID=1872076 RepID=A0A1E3XBC2_9BACT|nr:MAG: spermidine synthase (putrescine aminopropyltransferase) [Candidatus Scalindua rubra]
MIRENKTWIFILCSMLFMGCYATISQVLLVREFLVVFFGNELCLGIILGTWLFGVAFGAATGGRVADRFKNHLSAFIFVLILMCVILPLELIIIRALRHILNVPIGQYIPILSLLFSSVFIIMPFSFTIGFIFPIACRVIRGFTQDSAADIGFVYILESIGSLIGGLLFTFVLVLRFQPFTIIMIFDCILFLNILLMFLFFEKDPLRRGKTFACALLFFVAFILLISGIINKIDNYFINVRWNSSNPDIELLESVDSRYENIVIGVREDQYSVFGNGQYNFAFPNDYEYSQIAHLVMTQHPTPKRVLLIGGGMGGLIKGMLKHPIDELHYIELDPALIELTKKYLPPDEVEALSDRRVKTFPVDGRYFVKRAKMKKKYDLIFVNIPDPSTAFLNRYYTLQFFQEARDILKKNGVFAIGISSAVNYLGEEVGNYTGSVYQTLNNVFPHVIVSPGWANYYFASDSHDTATFDIQALTKRYVERGVKSEYFSEYVFYTLLPPERVKFIENEIKGRKGLRVNTDAKPVTYFFNLMLWDKLSGSQLGSVLQKLEKSHLKTFLIPIFVFFVCRVVYVIVFRRSTEVQQKFNSMAAIATTGFAGMALEIILIFAFQNIYGYVYEKIGLIIALFMFGLALGSGLSNRLILQGISGNTWSWLNPVRIIGQSIKHQPNHGSGNLKPLADDEKKEIDWIKILIVLEAIIVVYASIMPFILSRVTFQFYGSEYLFMLLVIITGILTGLEFPISSKLYFLCKRDSGITAGKVDSADHAGAFIGAILTGVLFVPIFGIGGSCIIIVVLNLVSMLFLIYLFFQRRKIVNLHN